MIEKLKDPKNFEEKILYPMVNIFRKKRRSYHLKEGDVQCLMYKILSEKLKDTTAEIVRAEKERITGESDIVLYNQHTKLMAIELKGRGGLAASKHSLKNKGFIKDIETFKKMLDVKTKYAINFIPCKNDQEEKSELPKFNEFKKVMYDYGLLEKLDKNTIAYIIYLCDIYEKSSKKGLKNKALIIRIRKKGEAGEYYAVSFKNEKTKPYSNLKTIEALYENSELNEFWRH